MYTRLEGQAPVGLGVLCYVIFLGTFEWGMVIPTLWPLLQRMGSEETYFGLVIGTFSLTRVICQPIIGALGDRFDFQVLLCSCLLCSALGGVLYALAPVPWLLLVSRVICGIGASCTPLLFAWTARALSGVEEVAAAQVRLNTMRSLGTFIGPFGSTLLCVLPEEGLFNELNSAGWAIAAANILGVVLCWYHLSDPPVPKGEPQALATSAAERGELAPARGIPTTPVIWTCLLFQVTTALLLAVLEVVPPIVLTNEFRLPPTATSVLFGVASLAVFVLFAVVEAGGEMPAVTAVEPRECLEGYEPKGQRRVLPGVRAAVVGACCSTGTADTYARTDPLYQPPAKACAGHHAGDLRGCLLFCQLRGSPTGEPCGDFRWLPRAAPDNACSGGCRDCGPGLCLLWLRRPEWPSGGPGRLVLAYQTEQETAAAGRAGGAALCPDRFVDLQAWDSKSIPGCVEACPAGSEAAILRGSPAGTSGLVKLCLLPTQRQAEAGVLLQCLNLSLSNLEVPWRSCLKQVANLGQLPDEDQQITHFGPVQHLRARGKDFSSFTNWAEVPRRLLGEEPRPLVWLIVASTLAAFCCCLACCLFRSCSCSRRKARSRKAAVQEGPPPDTHWRCAEGGLWWKGASSNSLEVEGLSDEELQERDQEGSRQLPRSQADSRPATSPGRMRTRVDSAPPRGAEDRPSTAPASPGCSASEYASRRQAWDARFAGRGTETDEVPFRPKPPSLRRGFAASVPGHGLYDRPSTPADTAPHLEVEYGILDRETNAQEFVQHLRHVRRMTTNADRKKLFKELQLRWHPDKNVGDEVHASEMFKALQESKGWFLLEERAWTAPGVVHSDTL
ncbi:MFSD8 [Symbiodinium pilosum]|uniref:MFSD8 protein n=1 Tax=Symbiodinium pilosum TaxID=2952 RepID=A0A812MD84_SYMPI|nr:MFSD8 [Symbiodinium pilosum]